MLAPVASPAFATSASSSISAARTASSISLNFRGNALRFAARAVQGRRRHLRLRPEGRQREQEDRPQCPPSAARALGRDRLRYREGQIVPGQVTKLAPFGAFVRLEGPIEGLIHISELVDRRINHPKEVVEEGDVLPVKVVRIEYDRHRLGLSLRQARDKAEEDGGRSPNRAARSRRPRRPSTNSASRRDRRAAPNPPSMATAKTGRRRTLKALSTARPPRQLRRRPKLPCHRTSRRALSRQTRRLSRLRVSQQQTNQQSRPRKRRPKPSHGEQTPRSPRPKPPPAEADTVTDEPRAGHDRR